MVYTPSENRYQSDMKYNRCGRTGLKLPTVSLGLWHNFGGVDTFENGRAIVLRAFDAGITHFDLANNYGPPPGSAEETFGKILKQDLAAYRDELVISTKAGHEMWPGPYGDGGSRKYMLASLDQSLRRMGLDYVDIFYHHRPIDDVPLEESMGALAHAVARGKALYVGVSKYEPARTKTAAKLLREMRAPLTIHQPSYNMFNRQIEEGLTQTLVDEGIGCIAFCPLAQGLLTDKYLNGIPEGSRASKPHGFLKAAQVTEDKVAKIRKLNEFAATRGQTLAQMALAWVLRIPAVTTVLIGASSTKQVDDNVAALKNLDFSYDELAVIEKILA